MHFFDAHFPYHPPADAEYWRRRAAGGAAMLIVGGTVTAPESTWRRRIVSEAWREDALAGMALRPRASLAQGDLKVNGDRVNAHPTSHLQRGQTGNVSPLRTTSSMRQRHCEW